MPVLQATIWSGRRHCQAEVIKALRWLEGVDSRLWMVHDSKQLRELRARMRGRAVRFVESASPAVPQYAPRTEHKGLVLRAWVELWPLLVADPAESDVLLVEDDIEVPPTAATRLQQAVDNPPLSEHRAVAVSGVTRCGDGRLPLFSFTPSLVQWPRIPGALTRVDGTGTFCMYLTREAIRLLADTGYSPALKVPGVEQMTGKDLHLCWWMGSHGGQVYVDPSVRCNHHVEVASGEVLIRKEMVK